jgi:hypothetical protein
MDKYSYWGEDGRCIFCGAGDDSHHSFTCETGFHPDKRTDSEQYLFNRIAALEAKYAALRNASKMVIDLFWDMSPLEFSNTYDYQSVDDEVGNDVLNSLRSMLADGEV